MKEVDTFCCFFICFLPNMVYHRAFLYRSVLCICIYKQIYTNSVCRLQSAFSVKGSLPPPNCKRSLYKQRKNKTKKTEAHPELMTASPSGSVSDWTVEWRRCDVRDVTAWIPFTPQGVGIFHLQLLFCWISYLQPELQMCPMGLWTLMTFPSTPHSPPPMRVGPVSKAGSSHPLLVFL